MFAGGATVEAAETITGAGIDTLDRLVAKSLLVRRHEEHGPTRLGMLETVRAYAAERFAALPDRESVRERHFAPLTCASLAATGSDSALDGPDTREHLACLDDELENFRAALRFAAERDAAERVLELSAALVDYWQRRDRSGRGRALGPAGAAQDGRRRRSGAAGPRARQGVLAALGYQAHGRASGAAHGGRDAREDGPGPRLPSGGALQLRRDSSLHRPVRRRRS